MYLFFIENFSFSISHKFWIVNHVITCPFLFEYNNNVIIYFLLIYVCNNQ